MPIDIDAVKAIRQTADRYSAQIKRLKDKGNDTTSIERTVAKAVQNLYWTAKLVYLFVRHEAGKAARPR